MIRSPAELRSKVCPRISLPSMRKRTGILRCTRSCERLSVVFRLSVGREEALRIFSCERRVRIEREGGEGRTLFIFGVIRLLTLLRRRCKSDRVAQIGEVGRAHV